MPNAYCDLTTFKNRTDISGTGNDTALRLLLEAASRMVDKYCRRHFFIETATRYYDGGESVFHLDDLLTVTTVKTDDNQDGTFETTWATADYVLLPYNLVPKNAIIVADGGDYRHIVRGQRKGLEIVGTWGFGTGESTTPYHNAGSNLNEALDTSETGVDVVSGTAFAAGQTILIDSEQMFVQSIATNTLTVKRGVNGTTAATHNNGAAINIYDYPEIIIEAALMQAARLWKRRDSSYATIVGAPEMGPFEVHQGLDPDIMVMLGPYRQALSMVV